MESSKEIEPAWTCCIGEYALDVSAQQISKYIDIFLNISQTLLFSFTFYSFTDASYLLDVVMKLL